MLLLLPDRMLRAATGEGTYLERAVYAMGTTVSISAFGSCREQLVEATSAAFAELHRLEKLLSVFRPDSDIGRLNARMGGTQQTVHADTWQVLARAKDFHRRSNGAFDVTVEPLLERWGFRDRAPSVRHTMIVGDSHLHLGDNCIVSIEHPEVRVDTGGIAVGYAVDRMAEVLRSHDVRVGLINHGGDVSAMGAPEGSPGWEVVVPHPTGKGDDLLQLSLMDEALSTSTNSKNIRTMEGTSVGHIFDPKKGTNPGACISMSVLASTSCEADALSTATFISGDTALLTREKYDYVVLRPGGQVETSLQ